tara:strand:+ start:3067 stop:3375 length:309 start_codon:yes stop_codon:yes gene_type:complete
MLSVIRKTRSSKINKVICNFINKKHIVNNGVDDSVGDSVDNSMRIMDTSGMFNPCPRDVCYCYDLIMCPEKTFITSKLIENAEKCKKEYFMMQELSEMFDNI